MSENVLVPLPNLLLPEDLPWRVGFVALVEEQLRRMRATGHFLPPRFFGYFFQGEFPVGVTGVWTVSLEIREPMTSLPGIIERLTNGDFSIASGRRDAVPDYLLLHDRLDGTCWLWSYAEGLRFIAALEPVSAVQGIDAERPKLLEP